MSKKNLKVFARIMELETFIDAVEKEINRGNDSEENEKLLVELYKKYNNLNIKEWTKNDKNDKNNICRW